jgi:selenocysteine lyase/cysteine desulfurase
MTEAGRLVGSGLEVPLVTGGARSYVNLDSAASAQALREVHDGVEAFLPWYSSVHRGTGFTSRVSTAAYEAARDAVHRFVGARRDDAVVFTRNTTDAINLLSRVLPAQTRVFVFETEHHANLLPWRPHRTTHLPAPTGPDEALGTLRSALAGASLARDDLALVSVTGASNVTGEVWPVERMAEIAHRFGARLLVDAAQLAPHAPIDVAAAGIDYVALSGHKLYAPYGSGALIGRPDWLGRGEPFLMGGGAVRFVTLDEVLWAELPDRQEAGSPNVVGAVAVGIACETLTGAGMDRLAAREHELRTRARARLSAVPGLELYTLWDDELPHIGVVTFNLRGYDHSLLATVLSAEHAIGVRHGCFCAHPMMLRILRVSGESAEDLRARLRRGEHPRLPGAVRMSMSIDTTEVDVDRLATALEEIAATGPRWRYQPDPITGEYEPVTDPRTPPALPYGILGRIPDMATTRGESS